MPEFCRRKNKPNSKPIWRKPVHIVRTWILFGKDCCDILSIRILLFSINKVLLTNDLLTVDEYE